MAKIMKQFRLQQEIIDILEELSNKTGKTQTQIVEEAIKQFYENENKQKFEVELYKKENEQLKLVLNTLQMTIKEKDEKYQDMKQNYEQRIAELKSFIEINRKKWWQFWK